MLTAECKQPNDVRDFRYTRIQYDVSEGLEIENKEYQVTDDMDFLGGIGRSFKILSNYETKVPFASDAPSLHLLLGNCGSKSKIFVNFFSIP